MAHDATADVPPRFADAVLDAAAAWLTELMSGQATEQDIQQWRQWRAADPEHERAWQHLERVTGRIALLDRKAAVASLSPQPRSTARRQALKAIAALGISGAGGFALVRSPHGRQALADVRTAKGEQRTLALGPGMTAVLNTHSALNLSLQDARRHVELLSGEVMIDTQHAAADASVLLRTPFARVDFMHALVQARRFDDYTWVAVHAGAAAVSLQSGAATTALAAGEAIRLGARAAKPIEQLAPTAGAWRDGQLIVDDMPLAIFLAELSRYRPGVIRCDPRVGQRLVSGVFPLQDTDAVLKALSSALSVRVRQRTAWWVVVEPA